MFILHGNLITEMIKLDEEILETMQDILMIPSNSNKEDQKELYDYLKMFINREQRLISKIPKEKEFINYIKDNINNMVMEKIANSVNTGRVISRITSMFNGLASSIKPSERVVNVVGGNEIEHYDLEEEYNIKIIFKSYNILLLKRYLKSLEDMKSLDIYEDDGLLAVQFLNIFIYPDICQEFSENNFDINSFKTMSDHEFMKINDFDSEEFLEMKRRIIFNNISVLISLLLCNEKDSIDYLDAELNLKYLLSELSYDDLIDFSDGLNREFDNIDLSEEKIDILNTLISYIEKECYRKGTVIDTDSDKIEYDSLTNYDHDKLINLVCFEKKLLELFDKYAFLSNDIDKIKSMISLESDIIKSIDFNSVLLTDLNIFINVELKKLLNKDNFDREFRLINYRIGNLVPQFRSLFISPSQNEISYDNILRNYLAETLDVYYDLISTISDDDIKEVFLQTYKDRFFMYPILTEELVSFGGNSRMIESVSDELVMEVAGIEEVEYSYDVNEQLFSEAENIIEDFSEFDLSCFGSSYCQLRLIQFDYIVRSISSDKLELLLEVIYNNSNLDESFKSILLEMVSVNIINMDYDLEVSFEDNDIFVNVLKNNVIK